MAHAVSASFPRQAQNHRDKALSKPKGKARKVSWDTHFLPFRVFCGQSSRASCL